MGVKNVWRSKSEIQLHSYLRNLVFEQLQKNGKILIEVEVTDTLKNQLRYGHLCGFLEAKMVILGPIDL